MAATREEVIRTFPELAKPSKGLDPDNPERTNEDIIQDWIKYWSGLSVAIATSLKRT